MLSKEEIAKITEQETLRYQIKKELEKKEDKGNRFLAFFNSTLGIFILSTFFISFLSWAYTEYSACRKNEAEKSSRIEKLKQEVIYRTGIIRDLMADSMSRSETRQLDVLFTGNLDYQLQFGPIPNQSYFMADEFKSRGLIQILGELRSLDKEQSYNKAMDAYKKAHKISLRLQRDITQMVMGRGDETTKIFMMPDESIAYDHEIAPDFLK